MAGGCTNTMARYSLLISGQWAQCAFDRGGGVFSAFVLCLWRRTCGGIRCHVIISPAAPATPFSPIRSSSSSLLPPLPLVPLPLRWAIKVWNEPLWYGCWLRRRVVSFSVLCQWSCNSTAYLLVHWSLEKETGRVLDRIQYWSDLLKKCHQR